ncbi:MAG: sialidase [Verrucomicrobia bacterium]|nr:sialidase [Verrucomicrobiota bacterium]
MVICLIAAILSVREVAAAEASRSGSVNTSSDLIKSEFIFEQAPFRSCHASTIVETRDGLLCAWFGGTREGALDVGIWLSRHEGKAWSEPIEVANGYNEENRVRYPCWNPVLFQPKTGPLYLFYKVGRNPRSWWGMMRISENNGRTWQPAKRLPSGIYGPIKNKPIELADNILLCGSSTEDAGWRVHLERTRTLSPQWWRTGPVNSAMEYGAIQPTILWHQSGKLQILCRTKQRQIAESWSADNGSTWSRMMATELPNPNSGFDAVMLRDGRALLVYNHSKADRSVLNVALSPDGKKWHAASVLENQAGSEFSYPAVIQTSDGMVHATYTWKRERIKHIVLDPFKLALQEIVGGQWP